MIITGGYNHILGMILSGLFSRMVPFQFVMPIGGNFYPQRFGSIAGEFLSPDNRNNRPLQSLVKFNPMNGLKEFESPSTDSPSELALVTTNSRYACNNLQSN